MENEFLKYEEALALKELGFDGECLAFYSPKEELHPVFQEPSKGPYFNNGSFIETLRAPLYQQAFRWFREKYRLQPSVNSFCFEEYSFIIMDNRNEILYPIYHKLLDDGKKNSWEYETYEEAELHCLKKLIEICSNK